MICADGVSIVDEWIWPDDRTAPAQIAAKASAILQPIAPFRVFNTGLDKLTGGFSGIVGFFLRHVITSIVIVVVMLMLIVWMIVVMIIYIHMKMVMIVMIMCMVIIAH